MRRVTRSSKLSRHLSVRAIVMVLFVAAFVGPAGAENPSDVAADLVDDGLYVANSRSSEVVVDDMLGVIEMASAEGVSMAIVWPDDPQPNTGAFARRVQEATMLDAVLVFGPEESFGSFVSEDYEEGAIRAAAAARALTDPAAQGEAFITGLLEEPVRERPPIIDDLVRWIVLLLGALVIAALGEQMIRQFKKSRKRKKLAQQLDAREVESV